MRLRRRMDSERSDACTTNPRPTPSPSPESPARNADAPSTPSTGRSASLVRAGARRADRQLDAAGEYRALLDALLLKARHELGLAADPGRGLAALPEPVRTQYEERYVEAIRRVGLEAPRRRRHPHGLGLFPRDRRARARRRPHSTRISPTDDDERLGQIIDVAFNQGANPSRGFELILDHYGTCSAITAFEQLPPGDEATRVACVERLVRQLHAQLVANLRAEIAQRGQPLPPARAPRSPT